MYPILGVTGVEGGIHLIEIEGADKFANYRNMVELVLY